MKKKKFGFTIAEVATSMAILGVIAAMLMPQVVKNMQKNQAGAILGRVVEQITLGNQNYIQISNMEKNSQTDVLGTIEKFYNNEYIDIIPTFWGLESEELPVNNIQALKNFDNTEANETYENKIITVGHPFKISRLTAGVSYYEPNNLTPMDGSSVDTGVEIYIDTTGWDKGPNTFGRDIFAFHLINNGTLKPFNEDDADNGLELTERVVRDGFKVTYD